LRVLDYSSGANRVFLALRGLGIGLLGAWALGLGGCLLTPNSKAIEVEEGPQDESRASIGDLLGAYPGDLKKCMLIESPELALESRIELIEAARTNIDIQYFIWKNDEAGILLVESLLEAADRGVKVRALIDDLNLEGLIGRIAAINSHPNLEIRVFNPFNLQQNVRLHVLRLAEFVIDGNRLNHRMHNKLLVADGEMGMLGGRNLGNAYFGRSDRRNFIDTDILMSGPIVGELSDGFEAYWNSPLARPAERMLDLTFSRMSLERVRKRINNRLAKHPDLRQLTDGFPSLEFFQEFLLSPNYEWASGVIDEPSVGWFEDATELADQLSEIASRAEKEVVVATPYLIPTKKALEIARTLVSRGVKVSVLTNSLASNDVVIAQAAYSRMRKEILDTGVQIYELKGDPAIAEGQAVTSMSMHSKYILLDDDTVFIGSQNLDPRSLYINTELGVIIKSKELRSEIKRSFNQLVMPENAWRVEQSADGFIWRSSDAVLKKEPARNAWQQFQHSVMKLIPISGQL